MKEWWLVLAEGDPRRRPERQTVREALEDLGEAMEALRQSLARAASQRDEARRVARECWHGWRLYADTGYPPGVSPAARELEAMADEFAWLKEKE